MQTEEEQGKVANWQDGPLAAISNPDLNDHFFCRQAFAKCLLKRESSQHLRSGAIIIGQCVTGEVWLG